MDVQNLVDAIMQALMKNDTEAIKGILTQVSHSDSIFPSVANGGAQVSALNLFLRVNATVPEATSRWIHGGRYGIVVHRWSSSFDEALGNILLHQAVALSDYELIKLLLENGVDVTATDYRKGATALHIACETAASLEIITYLTKNSPAFILDLQDGCKRTPLDYACQYSCPDVVRFLLSRGSSVGAKDEYRCPVWHAVLHEVAEYRKPIVSLLLDAGANITRLALICALRRHGYIMSPAANPIISQPYSCVDICIFLIEHGCDINATEAGDTALHVAVKENLENIVRKLLVSGCDIDKFDFFGNTPLHIACENGNKRLVDLLTISGANLQAIDRETTLERWRNSRRLNEKNTQLLNYVIYQSKQVLALEQLCNIIIRKNVRNVEKNAIQLGLPPLLVKRLQLKD